MLINVMPEPGLGGLIERFMQWISCMSFGECMVIQ
ncbi:hypothetical protein cgR_1741 [Corynebacterium glutamicum R]|uniref:Uncharacterized protein n=1 Tax=Corynebacterium glutamicum (strain R) TaxID=340322 RepID=A0AB72VBA0_CORGB|nr:hypothetical protein cgR_1741 [Corynebacterium glutamicum R]